MGGATISPATRPSMNSVMEGCGVASITWAIPGTNAGAYDAGKLVTSTKL